MNMLAIHLLAASLAFNDPSWEHASVSVYAVDAESGEVLFEENSEKSLCPASCIKIITTAAALSLLGPEARFQTDLEYDGSIDEKGVLRGNLYICGGGDPCLGSERIAPSLSWEKQIDAWAQAIQKLGIRSIEGQVIGDASQWESAMAAPSWLWEDLGNYYGAGASALSFHENAYSLVFRAGSKIGEKADVVRTDPPMPNLLLHNEVKTGPAGSGDRASVYGSEFSAAQYIRGTIPLDAREFSIKGAIPDPASCCAHLLADALASKGVFISQKILPQSRQRTIFHTTKSPPLKEIVHWTNQKSINLYAEHLLKKIGQAVFHEGSTAAGTKAVTEFWRSQNIDLAGFNMADGSGLSRKNLITAKQLVAVLLKMKKTDAFPIFFQSLPQKNDAVRAKSGAMSMVRAYAGYSGDTIFAIIVNNSLDPKLGEKVEKFIEKLTR